MLRRVGLAKIAILILLSVVVIVAELVFTPELVLF